MVKGSEKVRENGKEEWKEVKEEEWKEVKEDEKEVSFVNEINFPF